MLGLAALVVVVVSVVPRFVVAGGAPDESAPPPVALFLAGAWLVADALPEPADPREPPDPSAQAAPLPQMVTAAATPNAMAKPPARPTYASLGIRHIYLLRSIAVPETRRRAVTDRGRLADGGDDPQGPPPTARLARYGKRSAARLPPHGACVLSCRVGPESAPRKSLSSRLGPFAVGGGPSRRAVLAPQCARPFGVGRHPVQVWSARVVLATRRPPGRQYPTPGRDLVHIPRPDTKQNRRSEACAHVRSRIVSQVRSSAPASSSCNTGGRCPQPFPERLTRIARWRALSRRSQVSKSAGWLRDNAS
jgi:hypothetical protein